MADIENSTYNTIVTGTTEADSIANYAERVTIAALEGDDSIIN